MSKFITCEIDQVANGWNLNLIRKNKDNISYTDRIARFGGELCSKKYDQQRAKRMAFVCYDTLRNELEQRIKR